MSLVVVCKDGSITVTVNGHVSHVTAGQKLEITWDGPVMIKNDNETMASLFDRIQKWTHHEYGTCDSLQRKIEREGFDYFVESYTTIPIDNTALFRGIAMNHACHCWYIDCEKRKFGKICVPEGWDTWDIEQFSDDEDDEEDEDEDEDEEPSVKKIKTRDSDDLD